MNMTALYDLTQSAQMISWLLRVLATRYKPRELVLVLLGDGVALPRRHLVVFSINRAYATRNGVPDYRHGPRARTVVVAALEDQGKVMTQAR